MTQETRTTLLQYARQKYGDFRTTQSSPSFGRLCSDISNWLIRKGEDGQEATNDAHAFVTDMFVNGQKQDRGSTVTGDTSAGWSNMQGRIGATLDQWGKLGC